MGLDQYAYAATTETQYDEYWDKGVWNDEIKDYVSTVEKPREVQYWRKHPSMQGWMEKLWLEKGGDPALSFNGLQVELTWEDLDRLEKDIVANNLPKTTGFFFGEDSSAYYKEQDLAFVKAARAELFLGMRLFYNSSW